MSLSEIAGGYISDSDEDFEREEELQVPKKVLKPLVEDVDDLKEAEEAEETEEGIEATNYFDNSQSSSDSSSSDEEPQPKPKAATKKLTSARSILHSNTKDSVFSSEFAQAEAESKSVLEKHVKLTESLDLKGKANVCHAYRKGGCKRGNRCRFSHILPGGLLSNQAAASLAPGTCVSAPAAVYNEFGEEEAEVKKRKKRAGVTNSLVPPKKARALFDKLARDAERH